MTKPGYGPTEIPTNPPGEQSGLDAWEDNRTKPCNCDCGCKVKREPENDRCLYCRNGEHK